MLILFIGGFRLIYSQQPSETVPSLDPFQCDTRAAKNSGNDLGSNVYIYTHTRWRSGRSLVHGPHCVYLGCCWLPVCVAPSVWYYFFLFYYLPQTKLTWLTISYKFFFTSYLCISQTFSLLLDARKPNWTFTQFLFLSVLFALFYLYIFCVFCCFWFSLWIDSNALRVYFTL